MAKRWIVLTATHLAAAGAGYYLAPREMLDTEVKRSGFFTSDTKRVLSAAVESLRAENKLLVFSYKGVATVSVERTKWFVFGGRQDLIIPAAVSYFVDLQQLTLDKVEFNETAKIVTVHLTPPVMGDVAFEPEGARTINGGLLTWNEAQVEQLRKLNYATARRAFTKQAQGPALVQAAKAQAKKNVESYFEIPLRIAGQPDVRVVATFDDA